jgi:hypothetical protein
MIGDPEDSTHVLSFSPTELISLQQTRQSLLPVLFELIDPNINDRNALVFHDKPASTHGA